MKFTKKYQVNEFFEFCDRDSQKFLVRKIIKSLIDKGYEAESELPTRYGHIDIYANTDNHQLSPPLIIEVKKIKTYISYSRANIQILTAIGQLLAYSQEYPNAQLILCVDAPLKYKYIPLFEKFNIKYFHWKDLCSADWGILSL